VTSETGTHSFDRSREREAPASLSGHWLNGEPVTINLAQLTLLVAIKHQCDGCREFVRSPLSELEGQRVIVVSATDDPDGEWVGSSQPVLVAPDVLAALDIRWPPFYVLIDPASRRVVTEGVVFDAAQVARETARFRPR
jgi:hypothetical protein